MTVEIAPMLVSTTMRAVTVQALAICSTASTASKNERPWPPSALGMVMPQKPASASPVTMSQGYSPARSISAARRRTTRVAKSRARA